MLEMILNDVAGIVRGTFLNGDWISLAIAFGSVLIASFAMQRVSQIGAMTLLGLTLFVLGGFLRGVFQTAAPSTTGANVGAQVEASWTHFMGMQAGTLLAYFIAFMLLIMFVFGLKSVVSRG